MKNLLVKKSTGQLNLEFLAAAGLFLAAVIGLVASNQLLPGYDDNMDRMGLNLEAKTVSDQLITEPGRHSYGEGDHVWERNDSTLSNIEAVGIASGHHELDREKLEMLKTTTRPSGAEGLNYTQFREITGVDNQYRFNFVWLPTIQTNHSFIKGDPPDNPNIIEPGVSEYAAADNRVHYGSVTLQGQKYNMLVTSHDGTYDSLHVRQGDWDFSSINTGPDGEPYNLGDRILENDFVVERFQNREKSRGEFVVWRRKIKDFGPTTNADTEVITMNRLAVLEGEPVRIEVSAW
ncbi:MAG: hypothetical protein ACI9LV_000607 [Candidatus Nanohaloarchaea archaeon]|jgi:hypothetical protein